MIKNIVIVILSLFITVGAQDLQIKSLRTYSSLGEGTFPVVYSGISENSELIIEFDIKADLEPYLKIHFKFCDLNWQPYYNYFLVNEGYNIENSIWFDKLPVTANGADFHYKGNFPNNNVTFPFSGKWMYFITDSHNENKIYAEGKFIVALPDIPIYSKIKRYELEGANLFPRELAKTFEIRTSFTLPPEYYDNLVLGVEIIDNRRIEEPYWISRKEYDELRFYEWDAGKKFTFVARDIQPGNEYRTTDLRDHNRFGPPEANAQLDRLETEQFYRKRPLDINGGSVLTKWNNDFAQYFEVNFNLQPDPSFNKRIFLVGAFNNWLISPEYELFADGNNYSTTVELKRGMYDYQYVSAEGYKENIFNIDWLELEGNFWETENEYFIFLYYNTQEKGGYDKIIGFVKVNSRRVN